MTQQAHATQRLGEYQVPDNAKPEHCTSCYALIYWAHTVRGFAIPLSAATIQERDGVKYALTHFTDCPYANSHRRR